MHRGNPTGQGQTATDRPLCPCGNLHGASHKEAQPPSGRHPGQPATTKTNTTGKHRDQRSNPNTP
eukprot:7140377-Prorocentrum_lima.AAC.1